MHAAFAAEAARVTRRRREPSAGGGSRPTRASWLRISYAPRLRDRLHLRRPLRDTLDRELVVLHEDEPAQHPRPVGRRSESSPAAGRSSSSPAASTSRSARCSRMSGVVASHAGSARRRRARRSSRALRSASGSESSTGSSSTVGRINAFMATIGTNFVFSGLALVHDGRLPDQLSSSPSFSTLGRGEFVGVKYDGLGLARLRPRRSRSCCEMTTFGRYMLRQSAATREAARLSGMRVNLIRTTRVRDLGVLGRPGRDHRSARGSRPARQTSGAEHHAHRDRRRSSSAARASSEARARSGAPVLGVLLLDADRQRLQPAQHQPDLPAGRSRV